MDFDKYHPKCMHLYLNIQDINNRINNILDTFSGDPN